MIVDSPRAQNVTVGDALILTCSATGSPVPTIEWRQNGTSYNIRDPSVTSITTTDGIQSRSSILNVTNATASDTGLYQCVATNVVNTVTQNATVIVQGMCDIWLPCFKMLYRGVYIPACNLFNPLDLQLP